MLEPLEVMIHYSTSLSLFVRNLYQVLPLLVPADRGTKNTNIAIIQPVLRHYHIDSFAGETSFMYGRSTSNQVSRIIVINNITMYCSVVLFVARELNVFCLTCDVVALIGGLSF